MTVRGGDIPLAVPARIQGEEYDHPQSKDDPEPVNPVGEEHRVILPWELVVPEGLHFKGRGCFCRRRMVEESECPMEGCNGFGVAI